MLYKAILLAKIAHEGQLDKGGKPYIDHPLRVMRRLDSEREMIVGVLHDVLEDDSGITPHSLQAAGFDAGMIAALVTLTRARGERYYQYIIRVGRDQLARTVKLADLDDNLDPTRALPPHEIGLRLRYEIAREYLLHPEKYQTPEDARDDLTNSRE
jgi:(p)ppGpp synthase/HD superfamily hydrolase